MTSPQSPSELSEGGRKDLNVYLLGPTLTLITVILIFTVLALGL